MSARSPSSASSLRSPDDRAAISPLYADGSAMSIGAPFGVGGVPMAARPSVARVLSNEPDWKAVNGPRRASYAGFHQPQGFFQQPARVPMGFDTAQRRPSSTAPPPGFDGAQPMPPVIQSEGDVPIFHYFGGRSHGHRSFSFSVGPGQGPEMNGVPHRRGSSHMVPLQPVYDQDESNMVPLASMRSRSKSSSHIFGDFMPSVMEDGSPVDVQAVQDIWSNSMQNRRRVTMAHDPVLAAMGKQARGNMWQQTPMDDPNDIASRYFHRDPSLTEQRCVVKI